ncbi:hypothetical protein [Prescottella subtropica]|uniref:hypothetical protein n=1 Tax=Prescottella subtropica TaxID=2545757 RepID=UPI0010F4459D|nr:hypothetical protein [Prescottella subtropica]
MTRPLFWKRTSTVLAATAIALGAAVVLLLAAALITISIVVSRPSESLIPDLIPWGEPWMVPAWVIAIVAVGLVSFGSLAASSLANWLHRREACA